MQRHPAQINNLHGLLRSDPAAALRAASQIDADGADSPGEVSFVIGAALIALGREHDAEAALRRSLQHNPAHFDAGMALAHVQRVQARYAAAASTVESLARYARGSDEFVQHAIVFLRECQQHSTAERIWCESTAVRSAETFYLGGELALAIGNFAEAMQRFDLCLDLDPAHSAAIVRRAHCGVATKADGLRDRLGGLEREFNSLPEVTRIAVDFALGKIAMDQGDITSAFMYLDRANTGQREREPWDGRVMQPRETFAGSSSEGDDPKTRRGREVVLIVGMPRSGTTLLATHLGRHPGIADRGESPWLEMTGRPGITTDFYLRHLIRDDRPRSLYLDKNPLNYRFLDRVARELPLARVLHCRRDPRDTAISCYMQFFAHPDLGWTYAWRDIITFQRASDILIERRPPQLAWLDLDYEDLVTHPETCLRRVTDFLGLAWNPEMLTAGSTGSIATASVWQARQPIHRQSIGRWRACAPHVPDLLATYGGGNLPQKTR